MLLRGDGRRAGTVHTPDRPARPRPSRSGAREALDSARATDPVTAPPGAPGLPLAQAGAEAGLRRRRSSAAAGTAWPPPTTWRRTTASRTSRCSRRAGSAGGNMARNTTIIRSNYLWDESAAIYEHSLKLWEGLAEELDFDLLFSQRGVLNLAHNARRRPRGRAAGQRQPAQRHRRRVARRRRASQEFCPIVDIVAGRALPGARRDVPAARRHREARPRRLGLRARRRRARASTSSRTAR